MNLTPLQIIGIILAINGALTGATAQLTDLFGAVIAKDIVSVASLGSAILGGIITAISGQATMIRNVAAMPGVETITVNKMANPALATIAVDPSQSKVAATPQAAAAVNATARAVLNILLVAFLLSAFLFAPAAMAQTPRPRPAQPVDLVQKMKDDFSAKTGVQATGDLPYDLLKALDAKMLPDLQYALKLAQATGSNVTAPCYQAWIDMINTRLTAVQAKGADGTMADVPTPDPHLVTDFERMVELRNALQPDSKFMTSCSPVANLIKQDVVSFMGKVIAGGAGLATMIPGL